jgi:hypothetical protein
VPRSAWDTVAGHPLHHPLAPPGELIRVVLPRRIHILDGDGLGNGGHLAGTGIPGKSEFPRRWDDDTVIARVADVARFPQTVLALQDNDFWLVEGRRAGVTIRVVVTPSGLVWTAYPMVARPTRRRRPRCGR